MPEILMRGKFVLRKVNRNEYSEELEFDAVYGGTSNKEDNTFSEATPSAKITMSITNKALWGRFNPGDKFYSDFTKAEK